MGVRYYWEDFQVGKRLDLGSAVVTREDIILFAKAFDPQSFHIDESKGKDSTFGGLIASGWHTCSVVMRLMCDSYLLESASLGSPGMDSIKWILPVRPNDTISAYQTTISKKVSNSKPDRGIVKSSYEVLNHHGQVVMTMEGTGFFSCREVTT